MTGPGSILLSLLVLVSFALAAGGVYVLAARRDWKKGGLMLLAGAVALGNVMIWTL